MKEIYELRQKQSLPLEAKINMSLSRIRAWLDYCMECDKDAYVSFSGGIDSTVLLDLVRKVDPSVEAVFCNTGLENKEIVKFVKSTPYTKIIAPEINFMQVLTEYGYPLISKEVSECVSQARLSATTGKYTYRLAKLQGTALDKQGRKSLYNIEKYAPLLNAPFKVSRLCCNVMKKKPFNDYNKLHNSYPFIGTMAEESRSRTTSWRKTGCNAFESKHPHSMPLSFWTRQDILQYLTQKDLAFCKDAYGEIETQKQCKLCTTKAQRTGCEFCLFGAHCKDDKRFLLLKENNRRRYDFVMGGGEFDSEGFWRPSISGLGFWFIFEWAKKNLNLDYKF